MAFAFNFHVNFLVFFLFINLHAIFSALCLPNRRKPKPRLLFPCLFRLLPVATSGTGYVLGSGNAIDFMGLCWTCAGIMMVANSLNQDLKSDDGHAKESFGDAAKVEMEAGICGLQIVKNEDLEELKELGFGTFGIVYHGK